MYQILLIRMLQLYFTLKNTYLINFHASSLSDENGDVCARG